MKMTEPFYGIIEIIRRMNLNSRYTYVNVFISLEYVHDLLLSKKNKL